MVVDFIHTDRLHSNAAFFFCPQNCRLFFISLVYFPFLTRAGEKIVIFYFVFWVFFSPDNFYFSFWCCNRHATQYSRAYISSVCEHQANRIQIHIRHLRETNGVHFSVSPSNIEKEFKEIKILW